MLKFTGLTRVQKASKELKSEQGMKPTFKIEMTETEKSNRDKYA
jgi:hypothetical protein